MRFTRLISFDDDIRQVSECRHRAGRYLDSVVDQKRLLTIILRDGRRSEEDVVATSELVDRV